MNAKIAAALAAAAALLAAPGAAGAAEPASPAPAPDAEFVPGQLLVRFDPGVGKAESSALAAGQGAQVIERYGIVPRLALVHLPAGLGVRAAESSFESLDEVSAAQPNRIYHEAVAPNDEFFASTPNALWGLDNTGQLVPDPSSLNPPLTDPPFPTDPAGTPDADIDAPEAWDTETGDAAVTVGVIDSGVTLAHEDLANNLWANPGEIPGDSIDNDTPPNGLVDDVNGWDFVEDDATPDDASGHGTHVAGAVGAQGNNALGTTGAAWDVSIAALKAGSADGRLYSSSILDAIEYADDKDIPIVNASYIGTGSDDFLSLERTAYGNAGVPDVPGEQGTLFVVAAGNAGIDVDNTADAAAFPCAYTLPNILCVAATTPSDGLASFSNFGAKNVDVGAPGTNILSTEPKFAAPVFQDDFEDATLGKWVVETGDWFNSSESPKLGARALSDSPGGSYSNNENSSIRMATPISLAGKDSCRLSVASAFTLSTGDKLEVEFTTDPTPDLASTWDRLYFLPTPYTGNGAFAFRNLDMDLTGATGEAAVTVRFRLVTNSTGTADGVHIDNVRIECVDPAPPGSQNIYRVRQGTSMASPQVAGVAALVLSADPGQDLTVQQLRNTLLASVDPLASLKCKTRTGGRINAQTALGIDPATASPPPAPICAPSTNQPPIVITPVPPQEPVKKSKCKKPKKSASAKAKAKYKKCKRKRKKR
jgi:subtilisin family serine protease